uniref:Uncharacterized protein n=1 Tax=CrAss-like virus sp. ctYsL76 TaxID=2826826 RepID=A0A8S5QMV7_9CAUD|nr:MAG TPA: hypothetical protein [CrAss-like virus sp. ctYsL76]
MFRYLKSLIDFNIYLKLVQENLMQMQQTYY